MAWNKALPTGSTAVNASDNAIRDNWAYLRSALQQEHADPDANPSDPTQIVHTQGSGRVIVYTGSTGLTNSAAVVANVSSLYHDSRDIGRIVLDAGSGTPGFVWYCTATDTFVNLTRIAGTLNVGSTFTGSGSGSFAGLLTASAGLIVPSGFTMRGPPSEAFLTDGTLTMDPFAHAARHAFAGGDFIAGLLASNVVYKTGAGPVLPSAAPTVLATHTYDFSSRAGDTLVVAVGWSRFTWAGAYLATYTCQFTLNTVAKGQTAVAAGQDTASNQPMIVPGGIATAFLVPNSSGRVVDWNFVSTTNNVGTETSSGLANFGMLLLDLGTLGLTT